MYKSATKCNETIDKWCKNKHGASKIIDTFETYQDGIIESAISSYRLGICHGMDASGNLPWHGSMESAMAWQPSIRHTTSMGHPGLPV
jgi:hypothetical protein